MVSHRPAADRLPVSVRIACVVVGLVVCGASTTAMASTPVPSEEKASLEARIEAAIPRAVEILIERQESLPSPVGKSKRSRAGGKTEPEEWPYEGVYRVGGEIPVGYRIGGTSICALALLEAPGESEARRQAVERALAFVLRALEDSRMEPGFEVGYDVRGWGRAFALAFLVRGRELARYEAFGAKDVQSAIRRLIRDIEGSEIKGSGGWNYSRRRDRSGRIAASTFMTAPMVQALLAARAAGERVDDNVVGRALDVLERGRLESGAFQYGVAPERATNEGFEAVQGAIGRMAVCETTLRLAGRGGVERVRDSVDAFFEHWEWLEKRRRQHGTHVAPYMIAPYYFFYAHYYVAQAIEQLPESERAELRARLYEVLFRVREKSGGWNDRVFDRSENFGTAMTLLALLQPRLPGPAQWKSEAGDRSAGSGGR